jgi:methionyl-tRNA synthetase
MAEDGRKMSKSFNNVVDPNALVDKYGSDLVRYYLTKEFLIENDNNFSLKKMQELYNNDLANNYGNLVSRLIGMVNKYTDGKIKYTKGVKLDDQTKILIKTIKQTIKTYTTAVNQFKINVALNTVLELAKAANKYIENTKP